MTTAAQSVLDALEGVSYMVDADGVILSIGRPGWRAFALDNGAPALAEPAAVVGHDLFEFIAGAEVRGAYRTLLDRVRKGEPEVILPCHCDSPSLARDMRMTISPVRRGRGKAPGFLFHSIPLAEFARPPIPLYDFRGHPSDGGVPVIAMCSLCERICPIPLGPNSLADEWQRQWVDAETYYARGGRSEVGISHTVCPDCFGAWVAPWSRSATA